MKIYERINEAVQRANYIYMKEKYIECNILSLMQITIGYKNMRHEHKRVTISGGAFTKRQDPTGYSVTIHFS